ncbi:NfeD family protein [Aliiruegeria lutimaris]|uniref:NfeD-like C-terminal, partner-binding n=1 Tax=Aliiruegeria lutimaris TaxID=571298 RepID=A0A1G9E3U8_9RHOB|nr:hypothetical protein [Aliiruegeria lutimaris]SDK70778.1 hypothetical protein SAMN04488026_105031 [Aliiruegeria lutimaris]
MWWTAWWVWMVAGLALAILEVLAPGWIFLGFAIGSAVTGALLWIGGPFMAFVEGSLPLTLLVFAILSLVSWVVLRKVFGLRGGSVKTFDHDINEN